MRQAERRELLGIEPVAGEHDLVLVAPELRYVLGDLLEPGVGRLPVEPGGRQLDDPEARRAELVEQGLETRIRDDGDAT